METSHTVLLQLVVADHGQLTLWLLTLVTLGLHSVEMSKELVRIVESGVDHYSPVLVRVSSVPYKSYSFIEDVLFPHTVICSDLPQLPMGSISYSGGTSGSRPVDTVATHRCDSGLVFAFNRGNRIRTCQNDRQWSGGPPTCNGINQCPLVYTRNFHYYCKHIIPNTVPCPALSVANGRVSYGNGITGAPIPTYIVATYSCTTGYVLTGDSMRTCTSSGLWTRSDPVCVGGQRCMV